MLGLEGEAKRLELLHELLPAASTIAYLVNPTNAVFAETESRRLQVAARILGVRLLILNASMRQKVDIRYVVTSLEGSAQHLYENVYCQRGQMENLIKLHKAQLASDRMSCHSATANQVRLVLHTAAFWLIANDAPHQLSAVSQANGNLLDALSTVTTIINKITTNTVEIASIRICARALQSSVEIARLGEHVIARADRRAAHQVGGDRVSDALSQVEAVGDDGL
jgi:Transposase DDE domain group 1